VSPPTVVVTAPELVEPLAAERDDPLVEALADDDATWLDEPAALLVAAEPDPDPQPASSTTATTAVLTPSRLNLPGRSPAPRGGTDDNPAAQALDCSSPSTRPRRLLKTASPLSNTDVDSAGRGRRAQPYVAGAPALRELRWDVVR